MRLFLRLCKRTRYYLLGCGRPALRRIYLAKRGFGEWIDSLSDRTTLLGYHVLVGITAIGFTFALGVSWQLQNGSLSFALGVALLLFLVSFEAASMTVGAILRWLVPAREMPAMDFADGLPKEASTLVCVPSLLMDETQVEELVTRLESHWKNNKDPNIRFALLTDWLDSESEAPTGKEKEVLRLCASLVTGLNKKHGRKELTPFYLLHRDRRFSSMQGHWLSYERKMGKLQALNRLIVGSGNDFAQGTGNLSALRSTRYVVVLDDDTTTTPKSVQAMVGAIHHPLNRPVNHPQQGYTRRGYGMVSIPLLARKESLKNWKRPSLFLRSQAVADGWISYLQLCSIFFDVFGQAIFAGKGIYDVSLAKDLLHNRLPPERVLSHDVVEGAYLRTGFFNRATLLDDFPGCYFKYCDRLHRWIRGDWQNLGLLFYRGSMWGGNSYGKTIPAFLRFLILNNVRISFLVVIYTALVAISFALDCSLAEQRLLATLVVPLVPSYVLLITSIPRMVLEGRMMYEFKHWLRMFQHCHSKEFLRILTAPHQALLTLDAIGRTLYRMLLGRNLLEWNASSQVASLANRMKLFIAYLWLVPVICLMFGLYLWAQERVAIVAFIVLGIWILSPWAIRRLV